MNNLFKLSDDEMQTLQVGLLLSNQDMMGPERAEKVRNLVDRTMNYLKPDDAITEAAIAVDRYYALGLFLGTKRHGVTLVEHRLRLGRDEKE